MGKAEKISFPYIPIKHWWRLRSKFEQGVPTQITISYISSALSITEKNAKEHIIPPIKHIGLVDDEQKPTELAYNWRNDSEYKEFCENLIKKIYPKELHELYPDKNSPFDKIVSWFMTYAKVGKSAAQHYALFYLLLLRGDPSESEGVLKTETKMKPEKKKNAKADEIKSQKDPVEEQIIEHQEDEIPHTIKPVVPSSMPSLHIDIQIHISPESTTDQIDKIFESMAKHLKEFSK